jgi:hypothetical protein
MEDLLAKNDASRVIQVEDDERWNVCINLGCDRQCADKETCGNTNVSGCDNGSSPPTPTPTPTPELPTPTPEVQIRLLHQPQSRERMSVGFKMFSKVLYMEAM